MSLRRHPISAVPAETARVAQAVFPKGNLYMTLRDELVTLYTDEDFADLFPTHGQPAACPWRLALLCVLQFNDAAGMPRWLVTVAGRGYGSTSTSKKLRSTLNARRASSTSEVDGWSTASGASGVRSSRTALMVASAR
jgi:hypothetical protein